ncbi:hypothetical protein CKO15_13240, partial [Halorhodospira abdelmalekii]|nr:hypothetical protein [Halorhodospira abdelmalekii]
TAYREMMHDMHRAFQQLAVDAREQGDPRQAQRQLAQIQNSCVACHATYRFVTADDQ